ncbi:hypothetical protein QG37_02147 [Candidozyma auris]|nr:hypothetical protein QG37_02147 [[Candida] auris]
MAARRIFLLIGCVPLQESLQGKNAAEGARSAWAQRKTMSVVGFLGGIGDHRPTQFSGSASLGTLR